MAALPKTGLLQTLLLATPAIPPHQPHCHISQSFQTTISFYLGLQKIKLTSPVPDVTFFISPTLLLSLLKRSRLQHQGSTSTLSFQGKESSHLPEVTEAPEAIRLSTSSGQTLPSLTRPPALSSQLNFSVTGSKSCNSVLSGSF